MRQAQILLIEDTDSVREVITRQLEALGAIVTALADGDTVKRELDAKDYDLVIADIELAQGNGLDVIRYARTHLPPNHSPVFVVLSNHTYFHYRKIAQQLGVQHFFDKSLQFDQAIQVVGHMAQQAGVQTK